VSSPILPRVAEGDRDAVADCLERYGNLVWSLAARSLENRADAESAVQGVFVELWSSSGRFDETSASETAFVARVLRRRLAERTGASRPDETPAEPDSAAEHGDSSGPMGLETGNESPLPTRLTAVLREELVELTELAETATRLELQSADGGIEAMPETLRQRIQREAGRHLPRPRTTSRSSAEVVPFERPDSEEKWPTSLRYAGWYAAVAMLLLALWAGWDHTPDRPISVPAPLTSQRTTLMEQAPDAIQVEWAPSEIDEYSGVIGDVVWSPSLQAGFMRLRGLPANAPSEKQYQLWIVDAARDEHPVDGGVFDVPAGAGEVIVPIDAKLRVDDAETFAITLEQPGGVVVSAGPLLVVAAV
jgi:DNA-directed RNA polymerase specialized sigma24 family protein